MPVAASSRRLLHLFKANLLRERVDPPVLGLIKKYLPILQRDPDAGFNFRQRDFGGRILGEAGIYAHPERLVVSELVADVDQLFRASLDRVPPAVRKQIPFDADLLSRLGDGDNRRVHGVAEQLAQASQTLRLGGTPESRRLGESWNFLASLLHLVPPSVVRGAPIECVFCHRHVARGVVCDRHRDAENRMASSAVQRQAYAAGLQKVEEAAVARATKHAKTLQAALAAEEAGSLTVGQVSTVVDELYGKSVLDLWHKAKGHAKDSAPAEPAMVAWYTLPDIADPLGAQQPKQRTGDEPAPMSRLTALLGDMGRFVAYHIAGREHTIRRRTFLRDEATVNELRARRRRGDTLDALAERYGISVSQVRNLLARGAPAKARTPAGRPRKRTAAPKASAEAAPAEAARPAATRKPATRKREAATGQAKKASAPRRRPRARA